LSIGIWDFSALSDKVNRFYLNKISDHQQSWRYEDGPWKGPGPPLLVVADFLKRIF
jgi:hypothetical protein